MAIAGTGLEAKNSCAAAVASSMVEYQALEHKKRGVWSSASLKRMV